jgi:hypothetical protein
MQGTNKTWFVAQWFKDKLKFFGFPGLQLSPTDQEKTLQDLDRVAKGVGRCDFLPKELGGWGPSQRGTTPSSKNDKGDAAELKAKVLMLETKLAEKNKEAGGKKERKKSSSSAKTVGAVSSFDSVTEDMGDGAYRFDEDTQQWVGNEE